jgi:PAB-dependent poly(A)-specific ribonuclease subunit 2
MAFGDADGLIHLMTAGDEEEPLPLNGFDGQPIEWADDPEPLPSIQWTDSTYGTNSHLFLPESLTDVGR